MRKTENIMSCGRHRPSIMRSRILNYKADCIEHLFEAGARLPLIPDVLCSRFFSMTGTFLFLFLQRSVNFVSSLSGQPAKIQMNQTKDKQENGCDFQKAQWG